MSREKQIEETAELERLLRIRRMDIEKQGCDIWSLITKTESEEQSIANYLIGHGYRKASDVAREIFEEVEEMLNLQAKIVCETRDKYRETDEPMLSFIAMLDGRIYSLRVVEEHIAELKKKYTKEE